MRFESCLIVQGKFKYRVRLYLARRSALAILATRRPTSVQVLPSLPTIYSPAIWDSSKPDTGTPVCTSLRRALLCSATLLRSGREQPTTNFGWTLHTAVHFKDDTPCTTKRRYVRIITLITTLHNASERPTYQQEREPAPAPQYS